MRLLTLSSIVLSLSLVQCGSTSSTTPVVQADSGPPVINDDAGIDAGPPPAEALAEMNEARTLMTAVVASDGRVRVAGGLGTLGVSNSMESYDAVTNSWEMGAFAKVRRYAHTGTSDDAGNVYVFGGTANGSTPIASAEMFSPVTGLWTSLPDMPMARLGAASALGPDGNIYVIGGGTPGSPSNLVDVYSPKTKTWASGPAMPTARLSLVAVTAADHKIYAIGGRDSDAVPLATTEVLDTAAGTWQTLAPMSVRRYWFGATLAKDGLIYVAGGVGDTGFVGSVEAFAPSTGNWTTLKGLPEGRGWLTLAGIPDGRILAIGGAVQDGTPAKPSPLSTMVAYDPSTNAWSDSR